MTTARRRRRTPERAREELVTAAARLIAERGPDGVSLRRVAEAIGVSHALVSHYFGTYDRLVRAVLRRENEAVRARVLDQIRADRSVPLARAMMRVLFDTLADERYVRLFAWAELHPAQPGMSSYGLRDLVDAVETGIRQALADEAGPSRDRIEAVVLAGMSAAYGWALGRRSWLTGLGHDPDDPRHETAFRAALTTMLATHMTAQEAPA